MVDAMIEVRFVNRAPVDLVAMLPSTSTWVRIKWLAHAVLEIGCLAVFADATVYYPATTWRCCLLPFALAQQDPLILMKPIIQKTKWHPLVLEGAYMRKF